MLTPRFALLACLLFPLSCKKEQPADVAPPLATPDAGTATTDAPSEDREWNKRRVKEHDATPVEALGTLGEGIGIAVGKPAADATVADANGEKVQLSSLWAKGPVLLVFYRGGWCPYCNFQIRDLTQHHEKFSAHGITPVAISVDTIDESAKTQKTYEVPFPLLSDPDLRAHKAWNLLHEVGDEEHKKLLGYGIDIEKASGKSHRTIGVPGIFLIDQTGTVQWSHGSRDYKTRPKAEQLLTELAKVPALDKKE